tara:strand:- start:3970 stop:4125 length:156 start_codon:yes stop_codon:yes gene_type:complete
MCYYQQAFYFVELRLDRENVDDDSTDALPLFKSYQNQLIFSSILFQPTKFK